METFLIYLLIALFYYKILIISVIFCFKTVYDYIKILDIFTRRQLSYIWSSWCFHSLFVLHSFIYIILVVWWPLKETILLHPHWGCGTILITLKIKEMKKKINIFYFNFSEWGKNESISPTVLVWNQNVRNFSILLHSIWTGN